MTEKAEEMKSKAELYFKLRKKVHVVLNSKKWYNGAIKKIDKDFFIISDKKAEVPVLYKEVYNITVYEERK